MSKENTLQEPVGTVPQVENVPIEILEEIFTLYYRSRVFSPLVLKLVCRRWSTIVDDMPIMRSNILLAPDIHCQSCVTIAISAYQVQCKTISQLNRALHQLKGLKCKLKVLGCDMCFSKSSVYHTDIDKDLLNLRCRSLQIFTLTMELAMPILESLEDTTNLECFTAFTTKPRGSTYQVDLVQNAQCQILMKAPRTLRGLGAIVGDRFPLTDQHRQVIRHLDHLTICYNPGSAWATNFRDLFSCFVNVSKLEVRTPPWVRSGVSIPLVIASHRLQYLHLSGRDSDMRFMPKYVYAQLKTLKLTDVWSSPSLRDQYTMPNLQYLYLYRSYTALRWLDAPNLEYLSVYDSSGLLFGQHTNEWSIRPRVIATNMFTDNEKPPFNKLWKMVEEVEIQTLISSFVWESIARHVRHLFDAVRKGDTALCSLRQISILLHRTTTMDIQEGCRIVDVLRSSMKAPLEYGEAYSIQVRHRWAAVKHDPYMGCSFMTAEGSGWIYWV
jgi:hypothetical protein